MAEQQPKRPASPPQAAAPAPSRPADARQVGPDAAIANGLAAGGPLAPDGALRLFCAAAASRPSGRLVLAAPDRREYALTWKHGRVEHAASSDPQDGLGLFLVRKGTLSADQLRQAERAKPQSGGELVGALLALGLVHPSDVASVLEEHGALVVARALALEAGAWRWEPGVAPPPATFPLGSPWTTLCAAVRRLDAAGARRRLGDRATRAVARVGGRVRIEDLRLMPQELRAASAFDGTRSAAELARAQPDEAATLLRVALLLGAAELVSFGAVRSGVAAAAPAASGRAPASATARPAGPSVVAGAPPPRATPAPVPGPARAPAAAAPRSPAAAAPAAMPAPSAAARATPALDLVSLQALAEKLARADHFEALGVKRDAAGAQIKAAYFQLARTYHPDALADASSEVKAICATIFAKISEAWGVLGDDAKRASYLQTLESGGAGQLDVLHIFQAEQAFQAGTLLVKARRYDEALARFGEAIALHGDEPEYDMWKAWCEFLVSRDRRASQAPAARAIEAALTRNPRCAQGYLFLGQMAKIVGDLALAERHLKRGLAVAPDQPDLVRELKYLRK